ncbi:MAG: AAA family ATPase, partial [Methanosarcinales archaeon]
MLSKILIKNFKSIGEDGVELQLAPLTILVGPNGSGKSSVLEVLTFIHQSVYKKPTYKKNGVIDLESFENTVHKKDKNRWISIELHIISDSKKLIDLAKNLPEFKNLEINESKLGYRIETREEEIKQSVFFNDQEIMSAGYIRENKSYQMGFFVPDFLKEVRIQGMNVLFDISPDNLENLDKKEPKEYIDIISEIMNIFRDKIVKTYYISALRGEIPRKENFRGKPEWVGVHGENVIKLLALIYGSREYNEIQKNIIKWAYELEVADLHAGWAGNEILGCDYKDPKLDTILDLQFSGFGSKQIIPVIVQLFYSPSDSIIMVEEPEISLHPDAQTKLPEMFLEAINNGKQVIITTHSEHL